MRHEKEGFLTAVQSLLFLIVLALFIVTFTVQPFRIPSESMEPTLQVGDFLLVNKQAFSPRGPLDLALPPTPLHRGDIVVFHFPVDPAVHVVKRVVALPGDHLRLRNGKLFLNGRPAEDPYAFYTPTSPDIFRDDFPALHNMSLNVDPHWWSILRRNVSDGELVVPPANYFVMGDNRNNSEDSRYWGFVPASAIVGRPLVVYFSVTQSGFSVTLWQRFRKSLQSARIVR